MLESSETSEVFLRAMAGTANHPAVPLWLDVGDQTAAHGGRLLELTPKAFAVLRCLVERAGRLVTKEEILNAVWADVSVTEGVLTTCIREIRSSLGDEARAPRYVETVHRRGYRFIGPCRTTAEGSPAATRPERRRRAPRVLVGRQTELESLERAFERASSGDRQLVFVTGEAGIGKTALVDSLLDRVLVQGGILATCGRCLEQYGETEAYLPVLDALGRLGRSAAGERLVSVLRRHAPAWLAQLPALESVGSDGRPERRRADGATSGRLTRELAEAIEALTVDTPLVLVLEDLHWSDHATVGLVSFLAQRRETARLLLVGTFRPVEVIVRDHPLRDVKQSLRMRRLCEELALEGLGEDQVAEILAARFPGEDLPHRSLARLVHRRTEGNPLFIANVADSLVARGILTAAEGSWRLQGDLEAVDRIVPESMREMIEQQLDRCAEPERVVLETASVAGVEFPAAAVAGGLDLATEAVEERCRSLVRRERFLEAVAGPAWPDGTPTAHYGFRHAAYREVLYAGLTAGKRAALHRRIGERLEAAYGARSGEIAAELAVHFAEGRDAERTVEYLLRAGENAVRRSAHLEAVELFGRALAALRDLPDGVKRPPRELRVQLALGASLAATAGFGAPEVERAYGRAQELRLELGDAAEAAPVLRGLWRFRVVRADLGQARELADELMRRVAESGSAAFLPAAHHARGWTAFLRGDPAEARRHLERCLACPPASAGAVAGDDPAIVAPAHLAFPLWCLGDPDRALRCVERAVDQARDAGDAFALSYTHYLAAMIHQLRREPERALARADEALRIAEEQGFLMPGAVARILRGWALAGREPAELRAMAAALEEFRATGARSAVPYLLAVLAEAHRAAGETGAARSRLAEARAAVAATGERWWEAEIERLDGELLGSSPAAAEKCFRRALRVARTQGARLLELRALTSLARMLRRRGDGADVRSALAASVGAFRERVETADLRDARALLESLKHLLAVVLWWTMDACDCFGELIS